MMLFKIPKRLFKSSHYVELIRAKRVVATAKSLIGNGAGHTRVPNFLFLLIIQSNHQRIPKCSTVGFANPTWAIVLDTRIVALIANNAFQLNKHFSPCFG